MSLPKGYKRLEYIQSSRTQRINTGFAPNQNTRVVMDVKFPTAPTAAISTLFGAQDANSDQLWCWYWTNGNAFYFRYKSTPNVAVSGTVTDRNVIDLNGPTLTIGGASATASNATFSLTNTLYLFTLNQNGSAVQPGSFCLYSCQIYDNGVLVRDFVPCQNASGALGLWDAVNSVFYGNAGTGTFTAGPVVPEIVDESEITELEYIQSSGTQYLKTGFVPNQDARMKIKYQTDQTSAGGVAVVDSSWTSNAFGIWVNAAGYGASVYNNVVMYGDDPIEIDFNKNKLYKNGNLFWTGTESTFECPSDLTLMALNRNGSMQEYTTGKVFFCMLFDNGLLERDFIPAMLANGEVGLYDKVFHEFYRNAGTGEFIAGPEMAHKDYTELEYIEGSGAQHLDTGVIPAADISVLVKFMLTEAQTTGGIVSAEPTWGSNMFSVDAWAYRFGTTYQSHTLTANEEYNVLIESGVFYQNGEIAFTGSGAVEGSATFTLFAVNRGNYANEYAKARIYFCNLGKNEAALRGYIPRLHPSGIAGLWDSVNKRFYATATTTDFIAGPEAQTVPKSPANFRVESESDTLVTLAWDEGEDALGYRLYRQGQLLADITETSVSVEVEPFAGAVFTLTAYNENGEGAGTSLTHFSIPDNPLLYLITDRTQKDVAERNPKGYYAASDLNRVGYAMDYLANIIRGYGYTLEVHTKTDWTDWDWKLTGEMVQYLQSLNNLKSVFSTLVELPETMEKINYADANNIEQLLLTIDETVVRVVAGFTRANAYGLRSGAKGLPASQSDKGRNWGQLDAMGTTWANWQLATWYLLLYGNLEAEGVVE